MVTRPVQDKLVAGDLWDDELVRRRGLEPEQLLMEELSMRARSKRGKREFIPEEVRERD